MMVGRMRRGGDNAGVPAGDERTCGTEVELPNRDQNQWAMSGWC